MLMFAVGFVVAILLNFCIGWLVLLAASGEKSSTSTVREGRGRFAV
jgi:hypothetical protein